SFKKYLLKEINTGILIAVVLGGLFSLISVFWQQQPFYIGLILGISLFLTVISAILIGFLIPYLLQKFKKDPAIGSGPFATIITDICSLAIYFSVASLLLKLL
ncbi:magnesium transporter, partial [bacterium]|nr:magnesium transporter [bacterium]